MITKNKKIFTINFIGILLLLFWYPLIIGLGGSEIFVYLWLSYPILLLSSIINSIIIWHENKNKFEEEINNDNKLPLLSKILAIIILISILYISYVFFANKINTYISEKNYLNSGKNFYCDDKKIIKLGGEASFIDKKNLPSNVQFVYEVWPNEYDSSYSFNIGLIRYNNTLLLEEPFGKHQIGNWDDSYLLNCKDKEGKNILDFYVLEKIEFICDIENNIKISRSLDRQKFENYDNLDLYISGEYIEIGKINNYNKEILLNDLQDNNLKGKYLNYLKNCQNEQGKTLLDLYELIE